MARGDFDNLSNAGKPLETRNHNPYVDTVTHKLNEVEFSMRFCGFRYGLVQNQEYEADNTDLGKTGCF